MRHLATILITLALVVLTTFYHVQVGALETQEFRTTPAPFWFVCFSDTIKGGDETNVFCLPIEKDRP
jgi:hypothetical protein